MRQKDPSQRHHRQTPSAKKRAADPLGERHSILIVDDSADSRAILRAHLERESFSVVEAAGFAEAFQLALETRSDLVLSDVDMPRSDGLELCRMFRKDPRLRHLPIILISGTRLTEEDQLEGMEMGADDYLPKPYSRRLLAMKIRTILRRYRAPEELRETLRCAGLRVEPDSRRVRVKGELVRLTRKEFDILMLFLRRPGRVHSLRQIQQAVWGDDPYDVTDTHTVQVHLFTLRKKLGGDLGRKILNVPKLGYRLDL